MHTLTTDDIAERSKGHKIYLIMTPLFYAIYYNGEEWTCSTDKAYLQKVCEAMLRDVRLILDQPLAEIIDMTAAPITEGL